MKNWSVLQAILALALGSLVGAALSALVIHTLGSAALLAAIGGNLPWYVTRAAAITAYILLTVTMLLGLSITSKAPVRRLGRPDVFVLHEFLSWLAWGFVGLHVGSLLLDTYQPFRLIDVLVPFVSPYRTVAVGLGVISLYLIALLVTSFSVRSHLGHRTWRAIHFASFLLFVLATLHGIFAGSSTSMPLIQILYLLSGSSVGALLVYRIARARRSVVARSPSKPIPTALGSMRRIPQ